MDKTPGAFPQVIHRSGVTYVTLSSVSTCGIAPGFVAPSCYNDSMNNKMKSLSDALTAAGVGVTPNRVGSDTIFTTHGFGIFCTVTGNVQARDVYDKDNRFTLGSFAAADADLVASYLWYMALPVGER